MQVLFNLSELDVVMTDIRLCDGPGCDVTAPLDSSEMELAKLNATQFIVLERGFGFAPLHFHEDRCLTNWTLENTRAN